MFFCFYSGLQRVFVFLFRVFVYTGVEARDPRVRPERRTPAVLKACLRVWGLMLNLEASGLHSRHTNPCIPKRQFAHVKHSWCALERCLPRVDRESDRLLYKPGRASTTDIFKKVLTCLSGSGFQVRCRANMAHTRQSSPDYDLAPQVLNAFESCSIFARKRCEFL